MKRNIFLILLLSFSIITIYAEKSHSSFRITDENIINSIQQPKKLLDTNIFQVLKYKITNFIHLTKQSILNDNKEILNDNHIISSNYDVQNLQEEAIYEEADQSFFVKSKSYSPGILVLGMHRSGTSLTSGILNTLGFNPGGNLMPSRDENPKGYFERFDVALQNDSLLKLFNGTYRLNMMKYKHHIALSRIYSSEKENNYLKYYPYIGHYNNSVYLLHNNTQTFNQKVKSHFFDQGRSALSFFSSNSSFPWLIKDPRLCITLKTWLPLLPAIPSILFVFRHPIEVAKSLYARDKFPLDFGLRMWYIYNRLGLINSSDLCRVVLPLPDLLTQPVKEFDRITKELTEKCNVYFPRNATLEILDDFIDLNIQHNRNVNDESECIEVNKAAFKRLNISSDKINSYNLSDLSLTLDDLNSINFPSKLIYSTSSINHEELSLIYRESVRLYCSMINRNAFMNSYQFDERIKDIVPKN